ncbi:MAG TPA: adenylate/guanylate cyclase domain-containing protein, partial [Polyangiaceae bacterium]
MGWGFVRALVRPDHPEPVSVEHWRRGERAMLTVMPPLAALNVASRFLVAHDARIDLHAVDEFLAVNLTAHALLLGAAAYAFLRPRAEQVHRAATTVIVLAALGTVLPGLWLLGSLTPNLNTLFVIVTVAVVRVYYDSRLGLVALLAALVMHVGLVAVEAAGILQPDPLFIDGHRPLYGLLRVPAVSWIIAVYTMVWALSSYVAHRIRASEHALRELNTGLETRVREQVTALERAHRLRRYVAPQLADEILRSEADVTMRRERRPITVMFADIRGFTPMVERVAPDVLADVLNRYFDEVSKIAFSHGGTIDKFIGDAIMVFFGAPEATGERDQAVRCVAMGLEIQQRVRELGDEFVRLGAGAPLELRVGIGSGTATVGSFGAAHRSDYTVVGAPVNRAARLEPLAPAGSVLVDEETHT